MRPALVVGWLLALCVIPTIAAPPTQEQGTTILAEESVADEASTEDGKAVDYTIFNGLKVPPMIEIEGDKFAETVKEGYWYAGASYGAYPLD
jgi:hypothetical protein